MTASFSIKRPFDGYHAVLRTLPFAVVLLAGDGHITSDLLSHGSLASEAPHVYSTRPYACPDW